VNHLRADARGRCSASDVARVELHRVDSARRDNACALHGRRRAASTRFASWSSELIRRPRLVLARLHVASIDQPAICSGLPVREF